MRLHRSLTAESLAQRAPSKITLMVASEFWRASNDAEFPEDAMVCLSRARELMGVLETISVEPAIAADLQPLYRRCALHAITQSIKAGPECIRSFAQEAAIAFENAAKGLEQIVPASPAPLQKTTFSKR